MQPNPYQPLPQPTPKKRHTVRTAVLAVAGGLTALAVISAVAVAGGGPSTGPGAPVGNLPAPATTWSSDTTAPAPAAVDPSKFSITLKTTSKQCFGSYGCNVTVEPVIAYDGPEVTQTCDITYEVTGDKDGAITETAQGTTPGNYLAMPTILTSASSKASVSASVTAVECK